ncbi:MAG TPA: 3'(2'),5'-bisphosphate nucleotidase CysQ [Gammaproteobacteria bacterium]|nr:3'(2'),5'-bisphosphate nucleotidase CysQ [Gammaproteobacteria bacterium]
MTELTDDPSLPGELCAIAREAGAAILDAYGRDFSVRLKNDRSPLTEADQVSHAVIRGRLRELSLELPLLSEESPVEELSRRREWQRYWLVDPLDGTKEFLKRNGEFTVNIALIDTHRAVLGVVFAPALDHIYYGTIAQGAWQQRADRDAEAIHVRSTAGDPLRVVGSRSHPSGDLKAYLDALGPYELTPMGSSLKICLVAAGEADVYPRFGPTSEWDTAAAQAILESAGGRMIDRVGQPLRYNAKDHLLNPHFLAFGDQQRDWLAPIRKD